LTKTAGANCSGHFFPQEAEVTSLIIAFALVTTAVITCARAQVPTTMKLYDNRSGEVIGTATFMDRRTLVLRDLKGEIVGLAILERDGNTTFRDANGKPVDGLSVGDPVR
jgi:hypothetical protein